MGLLREQTRRFWTATLFLALGPALIGLTVFRIVQRSGRETKSLYENAISKVVGYDVRIERLEFLRPNFNRLVNVDFKNVSTQDAFAFSPEIYLFHSQDDKLLQQFKATFSRPNEPIKSEEQIELIVSDTSSSSLPEKTSTTPALSRSQKYLVVLMPTLYVKEGNLNEIKKTFQYQFENSFGISTGLARSEVVCLVVDQIIFQKESQFLASLDSHSSTPARKTKNTLLESFRSSTLLLPKTNETSENRIQPNDIIAFSTESPIIEHFRALYVDSNAYDHRKIDALFELSKMMSAVPYYVSIESSSREVSRFELSTNGEAIPGAFIARFAPFFQFLDSQGWMKGTVIATTNSNQETTSDLVRANIASAANQRVLLLKDFHVCQFDLDNVIRDLNFSGLSGVVTDLSIENGVVQNGEIQCVGRVEMRRGTIPSPLVQNLSRLGFITIAPKRVESLPFVNDALPFDAVDLHFELRNDGFILDSMYKNKIVAFYSTNNTKYGLYLTSAKSGEVETYANLLSSFTSAESEKTIWTPLVKKAFIHLPAVQTARREIDRSQYAR